MWARVWRNEEIWWCGLEKFGTRKGRVGGWRRLVIWWEGKDIYCCLSGRVVEERVDWKSGGNRQGVRDEVRG